MPPKKNQKGPSAKTLQKEKAKVVEDKTFGLKNKNKSKTVQNYVKQVSNQVMHGGDVKGGARALEERQYKEKEEKKKSVAQKALLASLFKGVTQIQTAEDGTIDKKKTLCPYFKAGVCEKGKKCKYSHDLALEDNRSLAIDLYTDPRAKIGKAPDTIITCKEFLTAVEKDLYGFNWVCPNNGDDCGYRHMLPQGYVIKRDKKGDTSSEEEDEMTLEEKIEEERAQLVYAECTPVTLETFNKWKEDKAAQKAQEIEDRIAQEEAKGRKDKGQMNFMSGRALFQYNPDLFEDAEDGVEEIVFEEDELSDDEESKVGAQGSGAQAHNGKAERERPAEEEKKEDDVEGVKVDQALFADEGAGADEDVDFD